MLSVPKLIETAPTTELFLDQSQTNTFEITCPSDGVYENFGLFNSEFDTSLQSVSLHYGGYLGGQKVRAFTDQCRDSIFRYMLWSKGTRRNIWL